ncbi:alpha/beta hydrolase fold protein [Thermomonospora curvata DSM 43183]|uniref:Alpha/beta hydrolase fold protein n=1 Tax=Thermomonospora curvata (strain ATCC 19995 / DSM 43183 / JCM 3096 / KCTC 9072 / NBRC 15933 / NCIMB 10081 / Henssen B9) TaxID=471852 RepID=D1A3K3_THECD|nr:alpha/beta fold hydrolase [Thermomonospora sp. CIF 1]ACY96128.1 alpha/beta hydrolase fold protein [Thermomonospora curvata DSM 43183]PKK16001.1 MAG: 2-hydroxy-6-oxo-2,4-heptadienoate hydrolase [Thermomonospora sp. CIF 1]
MEEPEIGRTVVANGIRTNYLEAGSGEPVILIHGSGPGVTAYANWRLTLPALGARLRALAPDMVGFGHTERPPGQRYGVEVWADQILGFMDALSLPRASLVGNSFGGAIALRVAARHPDRVHRLVLMGSAGVPFPITPGLDAVWGYEPSLEAMRRLLDIFAYSRELVTDELAEVRYRASIRPGFQESFRAMFPAPRQRWVDALVTPEEELKALPHRTLLVHGRDDRVIPLETSLRLLHLIEDSRLHVFGRCGHWTQIEHAAEFNRLVLEFLTDD